MLEFDICIENKPRKGALGRAGFKYPRWIDSVKEVKESYTEYERKNTVPIAKFSITDGRIHLADIEDKLKKNKNKDVCIRYYKTEDVNAPKTELIKHTVKLVNIIKTNKIMDPGGIMLCFDPDPTQEVIKKYMEDDT